MDSKQVIARFEAERQALALMDHAHIARVLDAGTTSAGRPYFVMDLVKGVPITRYCDEHRLTPRQRLELFLPVCQAVQHAHQKGIIHRDLKPSNVLVALYDGKPVPKVIDFGVAKAAGQPLTEKTLVTGFGNIVGTLEYMSPEQAEVNQLDIDTRSDIYSLGVLLYELLAGSPPFNRKELTQAGMLEMLRVIREQEPSKPSTKLSTAEGLPTLAANRGTEPAKLTRLVRGELDWIVMKALEKDRSRRYETANGFSMDVQRYLADEPVLACPPSAVYRLKKFVRRNKGPVLAAGLVALALVSGIIGTTWGLVRAERQREVAEANEREAIAERDAKDKALAAEKQARAAEKQARDRAMTALRALTDEIVQNQMARGTQLTEENKEFLRTIIKHFEGFAAIAADDAESRFIREEGLFRVGRMRHQLGELTEAEPAYAEALALLKQLAVDFPERPEFRQQLARTHDNLGLLLRDTGRLREAETAHGEAIAIQKQLAADLPARADIRKDLATSHYNLGYLLSRFPSRLKETEAAYAESLALRKQLAADFPTRPDFRWRLAATHNDLGSLFLNTGRLTEAEAAYGEAFALCKQLAADFPTRPEYRRALAATHGDLGLVLRTTRRFKEAETAHRNALVIQKQLAADFPAGPDFRHDLATSHCHLGSLFRETDRPKEAEAAYGEALAIQKQLAADFPTNPEFRKHLADTHNSLGIVLSSLGKRPEAEVAYRQALDIRTELAADFPTVTAHAVSLGGTYCNFGIWVREGGQPDAALAWYQKAIATLEPLVAKEPRPVDARFFLRNSHFARATALDDLGRHAEATRDWERSLELEESRDKEFFRSKLAESRLRMFCNKKDAAGCLRAAAEYEALNRIDAGRLYNAACHRAICAAVISEDPKTPAADAARLTREQADLAMAWLHKAVAAGFTDAEQIKQDKDLDALREREDFKKLLAELPAKKK
jgi:tetratricopeptide (TPR) repeat protein